ncbi:MAG: NADH-quinone oxidoreductase subunit J [Candidatus Eisenbacteria bacterium]|nr:NADH-quinone oxidoreductase subunit J [Candidatus Eisenbacteria bacterium]
MKPSDLFFVLFALMTVAPAFVVAFSRSLVHSAFALLFTLVGMAGLYGFLAADFLAVLQILLYVGGILVLILFGVLFTQKAHTPEATTGRFAFAPVLLVGAVLFAVLFVVLGIGISWPLAEERPAEPTIRTLGNLLLSRHLLPFEAASVVLLTVLIGAVAIARKELR